MAADRETTDYFFVIQNAKKETTSVTTVFLFLYLRRSAQLPKTTTTISLAPFYASEASVV
jgi:hypothetical protein